METDCLGFGKLNNSRSSIISKDIISPRGIAKLEKESIIRGRASLSLSNRKINENDYVEIDPKSLNTKVTIYDPSRTYGETAISKGRLLILDLDGILVDRIYCKGNTNDDTRYTNRHIKNGGRRTGNFLVWRRPHLKEFLDMCFANFDVVIWSVMTEEDMSPLANMAMGKYKDSILGILDQTDCERSLSLGSEEKLYIGEEFVKVDENETIIGPALVKNLSIIWRGFPQYNRFNTTILDNSNVRMIRNPKRCHFNPGTWKREFVNDKELSSNGRIYKYLEKVCAGVNLASE